MNLEFAEQTKQSLTFFVAGVPAPGGSKRAFAIKKGGVYTGRTVVFDDAGKRNKDWRASVAHVAAMEMRAQESSGFPGGALIVTFEFKMPRIKAHFRQSKKTGPTLREDAPIYHTTKPDTTKLVRSTEDALTGIAWGDDAQIAVQTASKTYGDQPGCKITITQL